MTCGSVLQVTPSSKVVGDLAQFMVQNDLDDKKLVEKAGSLNLPARWGPSVGCMVLFRIYCMCCCVSCLAWSKYAAVCGADIR